MVTADLDGSVPTMPSLMDKALVEVVTLGVLAVVTAGLHYSHGFKPLYSDILGDLSVGGVGNTVLLIGFAAAVFYNHRWLYKFVGQQLDGKPTTRRRVHVLLGLSTGGTLAGLFWAGLLPKPTDHVVGKWLVANAELRGWKDFLWCVRLFALLMVVQLVLGAVLMCLGGVYCLVTWPWRALKGDPEPVAARPGTVQAAAPEPHEASAATGGENLAGAGSGVAAEAAAAGGVEGAAVSEAAPEGGGELLHQ